MNKDKKPLSVTHPELAKEAYGWDPKKLISGTNKKLEWICEIGHIWNTTIPKRISGTSCPFCANRKVFSGFNDLATTHPELAKEASGWDPKKIISGTDKKLEWICDKGHKWRAIVVSRRNGNGCPVCSNHLVLEGFNDLMTTHPELAKEANGWDPKKISIGTNKILEWKCQKGHIWKTSGKARKNTSCPVCSNRKVIEGFNDFATTHPELSKQANGWDPKKVFAGSDKKLKWKCDKGHVWSTKVYARTAGRGCPSCAISGFDPNKHAFIYFLIQPRWEILQIGITNNPEVRLNSHKNNGFELIELRGPMDGHAAQELETALLRYLKNQKADLSPEHVAGKFDGYSESWTIDSYKVNNLKELIDKASEEGF